MTRPPPLPTLPDMVPTGPRRTLASVLFTDICGSTRLAASLGDKRWRALLDQHVAAVRRRLAEYDGREVSPTGDGMLASFTTPGQAVGCAFAIIDDAAGLDLEVRAGIHTGECEIRGSEVAGIAVHVAARLCDLAEARELLVSSTVRDLLDGADYDFDSRGTHQLKGVPQRRQVFAPRARVAEPASAGMDGNAVRVMLVDDHPLWRQMVRTVLESSGTVCVVAEADDGATVVDLARTHRPDVIVMDMQMRDVQGADATRAVSDSEVPARVLMLSATEDPESVLGAVRAGAAGYLLKSADASELRDAVRRIAAGEVVFPAALAAIVLGSLRGEGAAAGTVSDRRAQRDDAGNTRSAKLATLSARELEVLALMAEGMSNQAIAERLFVTLKTVEAHVSSIFTKLGMPPSDEMHRRVRAVVTYLTESHSGAD